MFIPANANSLIAPCFNCSKLVVCKYKDEVDSFVSSHRAQPEIECLSVEYKCKYFEQMKTNLRGFDDVVYAPTPSDTSSIYTTFDNKME